MATKSQIAANRKNAKRSTGPSTDAGKARSKMNSTRHGLLGRFHLIEGEDQQEFANFEEQTFVELKPVGTVERYFVGRWVRSAWLLNRADNVISTLLVNPESLHELSINELLNILRVLWAQSTRRFDELPELLKYSAATQTRRDADSTSDAQSARVVRILNEDVYLTSLEEKVLRHLNEGLVGAELARKKRRSTPIPAETDPGEDDRVEQPGIKTAVDTMAQAFVRNRESVALALRYRSKIERSRDSALHELQRLQAARDGLAVAPPSVVDVNVNSTGEGETGAQ